MSNVTVLEDHAALPRIFDADASGNSQPPEQVHPAQINFSSFGDNPALKRASETLGFTAEGLASIDKLRANPHPEDKPATHARKVRDHLHSFETARANRWDGAKAELKAEHRRVEAGLETAANLKANPAHFNAIVGTFQGMNPGQKAEALDQLIEQQDGPTLAALVEAPLLVTGLTAQQRDGIKLRLFAKVNPQGLALRDQLAKALEKMESGSIATLRACGQLRQGLDRFDKRASEAEAIANKARTGFAA